jgi:hypothetical protein
MTHTRIRTLVALLLLSGSSVIFAVASNVLSAAAIGPGDVVIAPGVTVHREPRLEPVTSHVRQILPAQSMSPEFQILVGMALIAGAFGLYTWSVLRRRHPHLEAELRATFRRALDRKIA